MRIAEAQGEEIKNKSKFWEFYQAIIGGAYMPIHI